MIGYQILEYNFKNALPSGVKINIQTKYQYNVRFSENNTCRGEMTCEVFDKEAPEKFNIKIVIVGVFGYKPDSQKPLVHVETFRALFPYARSYVSMATAASGIPALMIPDIDIESQNIYSFEKPHKPDDGKDDN